MKLDENKKEKSRKAMYQVLQRYAPFENLLLYDFDNYTVSRLLNAVVIGVGIQNDLIDNAEFISYFYRNRKRDIDRKLRKRERQKKVFLKMSQIERQYFIEILENGATSNIQMKFLRKLFFSRLRKIKAFRKSRNKMLRIGLNIGKAIDFFEENPDSFSRDKIQFDNSFSKKGKRYLVAIFNRCRFQIRKTEEFNERIQCGKHVLKRLNIKGQKDDEN